MKDFVDDIKEGISVLPKFLIFGVCIFGIMYLFFDMELAFKCFLVFMGIWAGIFIAFPCVILILKTTNKILGTDNKKK